MRVSDIGEPGIEVSAVRRPCEVAANAWPQAIDPCRRRPLIEDDRPIGGCAVRWIVGIRPTRSNNLASRELRSCTTHRPTPPDAQ